MTFDSLVNYLSPAWLHAYYIFSTSIELFLTIGAGTGVASYDGGVEDPSGS